MKIKCKAGGGQCPKGLDICCAVCDSKDACDGICGDWDLPECPDAEVINDELVQFQSAVPAAIQLITMVTQQKKELEDREKKLKAELVKAMEAHNIKSFENDLIKLTYVAPTTRSSIDSTKLKKDHPDIAEQYTKVSDVSASVRIALK